MPAEDEISDNTDRDIALVLDSSDLQPTPPVGPIYSHLCFSQISPSPTLRADLELKSIQARSTCLITKATTRSTQSPPCYPRHEGVMTTSELTLSPPAWLTASATTRDIPPTVSEQPSVRNDTKGHYMCVLLKVSDEDDVVFPVLDARDTTGAAATWSRSRCKSENKQLVFVLNKIWCVAISLYPPNLCSPIFLARLGAA
ncbi:hypothetical protein EDB87DRAFT_1688997 [Lactarius vividus]|nr:hypothetical protein EDB87DRAFT_1688997 [Lactarius vividus]